MVLFVSCFSIGFCQESSIRETPTVIKILPYVESAPMKEYQLPDDDKVRYSSEHGLGKTFLYQDPSMHIIKSADTALLMTMEQYRKDHLRKVNPLIARFVITFVQRDDSTNTAERQITIPSGLFISGMDAPDYRLSRKGGGILAQDDFFYSSTLTLTHHFKGCIFGEKDAKNTVESSSYASKEFKAIQELMKNKKEDVDKNIQPKIDQFQRELRKQIRGLEDEFVESKNKYFSKEGVYIVPSIIPGCFPITLQRMHDSKGRELQETHFKRVAGRVFGYPLETKKDTIFDEGVFGKFQNHLKHNQVQQQNIKNLFGKNILDEGCYSGCFESDFNYWFSDSEQVFIEWLETCNKIDFDTGNIIDFHDFTYGNVDLSEFNEHSFVTKIDIDLLSYLDMCPACRGTLSLLSEKKEGQLSWIEQRVRKLIRAWLCKNKNEIKEYSNIWAELVTMNTICTSLAKCDKGEAK
jgi:hypothetical protein